MSTTVGLEAKKIDTVRLVYGEKELVLPLVEGTERERAIDISRLRVETGMITLDEGFVNTGSTSSAITFLDGEKGILRYRAHRWSAPQYRTDDAASSFLRQ